MKITRPRVQGIEHARPRVALRRFLHASARTYSQNQHLPMVREYTTSHTGAVLNESHANVSLATHAENANHKESAMRHAASKRTVETNRYRPTCRRITGRTMRAVALPSALDAPDPSWLPEPVEEWEGDTDIVARFAIASQRD